LRKALLVIGIGLLAAAAPAAAADVDWTGATLPSGVTQTRIDVGGVHTRVLQAGPANAREAVVFVHGHPDSAADWGHLTSVAGQTGRAVAFDLAGFGRADKPAPDKFPYTVDGEAAFLGRALQALGIERVHLVLHDFGGPIGLQWAMTHADAVKSVLLLNTGVFVNYYGHPHAFVWHTPGVGEADMNATPYEGFYAQVQSGNPRLLPDPFVNRMWDEWDLATRAAAAKLYQSVENPDAMGRAQAAALRDHHIPALVIWGETDQYIPAYVAYQQSEAFPEAQVELIDSGHWPFVDNVDNVDELALPFWRRVVPTAAARPAAGLRLKLRHARAGARSVRPLVCPTSATPVANVRATLYRVARRTRAVGSAGPLTIARCTRLTLRLDRESLRAGAYRLVAAGGGVKRVKRTFHVRAREQRLGRGSGRHQLDRDAVQHRVA
jgi:pimeloyl-ACP methyl ester carboxylesterase